MYLDINNITGLNLYVYCNNNPIMYDDPEGNMPNWTKWLIGGIAFTGAVVLNSFNWRSVGIFIYWDGSFWWNSICYAIFYRETNKNGLVSYCLGDNYGYK